jgi:hypothetical protein
VRISNAVSQLLVGAARLVPTPRFFPLRLRLIRATHRYVCVFVWVWVWVWVWVCVCACVCMCVCMFWVAHIVESVFFSRPASFLCGCASSEPRTGMCVFVWVWVWVWVCVCVCVCACVCA